jgi:hypothetical protein
MTKLNKPVRRSTNAKAHTGRVLVVTLTPGMNDLISIREQGRRSAYSGTVEQIYKFLARVYADNLRAEKAKKKKESRGR